MVIPSILNYLHDIAREVIFGAGTGSHFSLPNLISCEKSIHLAMNATCERLTKSWTRLSNKAVRLKGIVYFLLPSSPVCTYTHTHPYTHTP